MRSKLIDKELVEKAKASLKEVGNEAFTTTRIKAIISSYKNGIKKVCEVYDVSRSSLHRWVKLFRERGIEGIKNASKPARSKLNKRQEAMVREWLEADANVTIKKLKIRIEEEFQTEIGKSSVHRLILKLGFSHITGRKRHYKSDPSAQAEFKKKSKNKESK